MGVKLCFAASTGGHYEQILLLKPIIEKYDSFLLTEATKYKTGEFEHKKTYFLKQVNRKEWMFPFLMVVNISKSMEIFVREKPDIVITTGALAMIPISMIAKLFRRKLIYIESFSKISSPTLTGRFLYRFADQFYVQWKEMLKFYPEAIYKGGIY